MIIVRCCCDVAAMLDADDVAISFLLCTEHIKEGLCRVFLNSRREVIMNVLRNNFELIADRVRAYELADGLWHLGLFTSSQVSDVSFEMTNKQSWTRLLDMIDELETKDECTYEIWAYIHTRYPNISFHIRQIELGARLRTPIGDRAEAVVTCSLSDEEMCVDIRKHKVS